MTYHCQAIMQPLCQPFIYIVSQWVILFHEFYNVFKLSPIRDTKNLVSKRSHYYSAFPSVAIWRQ